MYSGFFNVLHDAADDYVGPVGQGVHVHLGGLFEKLVDQHGSRRAHESGLRHIILDGVDVIGDDHGAATEHVTRAYQNGQADFTRHARGFFGDQRRAVARLGDSQFLEQAAEAPAVFRKVDGFRRGADNGNAIALQFQSKIQRRLPAELHDDALWLFAFDDRKHVFERQRLEIQAVRSVVVG